MDSFNFKLNKANSSILKFRKKRKMTIAALFRFIELSIFLIIIISKLSTHLPLPFDFSISVQLLRRVFAVNFISPRFVFLLGNLIVFVLFLKSGQFSDREGTEYNNNCKSDPYVESCEKFGIYEETKVISDVYCHKVRKMQRSNSETSRRVDYGGRKLKRSVTDICLSGEKSPDQSRKSAEEMSSEDFRRRIEDFIARRQRSLMEEELSATVN